MLESHKQLIAREADAYMGLHKMSAGKFAGLSGVNPSYLSYILRGDWNQFPVQGGKTTQIGDSHFLKLQTFLGMTLEVFETKPFIDILYALAQAKQNAGYSIIDGNTGQGKTFAVTEFQRQYPAGTYVVKCANSMTPRKMVQTIAEAVGVLPVGDNITIIEAVAAKMNATANAVLILDESEVMMKKRLAIGYIKDLYDKVENRAGIVIMGANDLLATMKARAAKNIESFPQVLRRFGAEPVMLSSGIDRDDAVAICSTYGVADKREVTQLIAQCENYGTLFSTLKKRKNDAEALSA
jgi:nucleoside-triphosphatase THEP1